jgi:hypothetical protein
MESPTAALVALAVRTTSSGRAVPVLLSLQAVSVIPTPMARAAAPTISLFKAIFL